jgi:hypothetical protein
MVIFALMAVFLLAIVGLAIDAGVSYFSSDAVQRAANAAALAGVAYLPGEFPQASNAALVESARNGFPEKGTFTPLTGATDSCNETPPNLPSPCVSVTQPAGNELTVTVSVSVPTTFLQLIGFGPHTVVRSATAEYLPPIALGQPGTQLGSVMGAAAGDLGQANGGYILRTKGWGTERKTGNPFDSTPTDDEASCGPDLTNCNAASPVDVHEISGIDGTELSDNDINGSQNTDCGQSANQLCLNDIGGSNFLIWVPAGQSTTLEVYNPSSDPGNDSNSGCANVSAEQCAFTIHDDDGSMPDLSNCATPGDPAVTCVPVSDYDSMGYTVFAVQTLSDRDDDIPLLQDIFCPFDAYDLDTGKADYSYYPDGSGGAACNPDSDVTPSTPKVVNNVTSLPLWNAPPGYSGSLPTGPNWISVVNPTVTSPASSGVPANLYLQNYTLDDVSPSEYSQYVNAGGQLTGGANGTYYRLRVDTLNWNGAVITNEDETSQPAANGDASNNGYPQGQNAYALQVTTTTCAGCTLSGMDDMSAFTPLYGPSGNTDFAVPLFSLPASYAGSVVQVALFNAGTGSGGTVDVGILQPAFGSTTERFATIASTGACGAQPTDPDYLGTSLSLLSGSNCGTPEPMSTEPVAPATPGSAGCTAISPTYPCNTSSSAFIEVGTASVNGNGDQYSGDNVYRGSWLVFDIQVPTNYNPSAAAYWSLFYGIQPATSADNSFTLQVSYLGSPIHLLP